MNEAKRPVFLSSLTLGLGLTMSSLAWGQVAFSPDITLSLGGTVVTDEDVANDDLVGPLTLSDLGTIPVAAEVDAYARVGSDHLFSLDTVTSLDGGLVAHPADVVRYDGAAYSIEFDALAAGVPAGANVDAVSIDGSDLVLSFDTTVALDGGVVAADEDLVSFDGDGFALVFDGSGAGLDPALDLDAVDMSTDGAFFASLDQPGSIDGVVFDDDTILLYSGSAWSGPGTYRTSTRRSGQRTSSRCPSPLPAAAWRLARSRWSRWLAGGEAGPRTSRPSGPPTARRSEAVPGPRYRPRRESVFRAA